VLEDPGGVVGDEDGVEAGLERGVDVGFGGVADHPGGGRVERVARDEVEVGGGVLFGEDLDGGEDGSQAGAVELVGLLFDVALGDEQEAVAEAEAAEGIGYAGEEFDLGGGDDVGEGVNAGFQLGGEGRGGELLEAGNERHAETGEAVAVGGDGGVLAGVEVGADLVGGVGVVVEEGDEVGDGLLEVDVVLPEGVVGVEEQGLVGHKEKYRGRVRATIVDGGYDAATCMDVYVARYRRKRVGDAGVRVGHAAAGVLGRAVAELQRLSDARRARADGMEPGAVAGCGNAAAGWAGVGRGRGGRGVCAGGVGGGDVGLCAAAASVDGCGWA
jgi:hypothetical protein